LLLVAACSGEPDPARPYGWRPPAGEHTLVTLIPAWHIKLNARLKPASSLADGSVPSRHPLAQSPTGLCRAPGRPGDTAGCAGPGERKRTTLLCVARSCSEP
jgi:hypothetical protein